jgi:hypothetical protein
VGCGLVVASDGETLSVGASGIVPVGVVGAIEVTIASGCCCLRVERLFLGVAAVPAVEGSLLGAEDLLRLGVDMTRTGEPADEALEIPAIALMSVGTDVVFVVTEVGAESSGNGAGASWTI